MARPTIGHMDPEFIRMMEEIKKLLQHAFRTKNEMTLVVSGPGSAGMETCFVNLLEPGDKVVVCRNGVFGGRMKENVERCGGIPIVVEGEWGRAVDPDKVEDALKKNPDARFLAFVHAETNAGGVRAGDRRRPRTDGRQDLADRPDGALLEPEKRHVLRKRPENGSRLSAPFGAVPLRHSRGILTPRGRVMPPHEGKCFR